MIYAKHCLKGEGVEKCSECPWYKDHCDGDEDVKE